MSKIKQYAEEYYGEENPSLYVGDELWVGAGTACMIMITKIHQNIWDKK